MIMSGRKPAPNKVTLGMLKGKSIATSVPSFAIRFHTGDEELEEIYPSAEETDDEGEKTEDDASSAKDTSGVPSPGEQASSLATHTGSTSASATTAPSRDPSPMKEYLKGLGKRSTSMDAGIIDIGTFGSSGSDTWRIFHELKGKITKTVEEKFSEIKSDRKSSSSLLSSGSELGRAGRLSGKSKESSSISDSEDLSELSTKSVPDLKNDSSKLDGSPLKLAGKDPKQSSSFEVRERDDFLSDSLTDPPSTSSAVEASDVVDISAQGLVRKSNFRSKMRHLSNLRHRHTRSSGSSRSSLGSTITMSSLSASASKDAPNATAEDPDIEPAIEASEDTRFSLERSDSFVIEPNIPTVDYRTGIPTSHPPHRPPRRHPRRHRRNILATLWTFKYIFLALVFLILCLTLGVPSYVIGFILGALFVILVNYLRNTIERLLSPISKSPNSELLLMEGTQKKDSMTILKIPAIKEYQPLTRYAGWMNEYMEEYVPEKYTINDTQSVYIRLEGSVLRISHTRMKIPKRAMWNERKHKLKFTHQRIYDICGCDIKLLPEGLARKRLWSKKYPICIMLKSFTKYGIEYLQDTNDNIEKDDHPEAVGAENEPNSQSVGEELVNVTDAGKDEPSKNGNTDLSRDVTKSPETKKSTDDLKKLSDKKSTDDTKKPSDTSRKSPEKLTGDVTKLPEKKVSSDTTNLPEKKPSNDTPKLPEKFTDDELSVLDDLSDEDTFCHVDKTALEETCLYLFARTDREKEDWYRRFVAAAKFSEVQEESVAALPSKTETEQEGPDVAGGSQMSEPLQEANESPPSETHITPKELEDANLEYLKFMSRFHLQVLTPKGLRILSEPLSSQNKNSQKPGLREKNVDAQLLKSVDRDIHSDAMWLNAFVGRVLFDLMRNPYWVMRLQERIQKKLAVIKLPYFVEELLVTELEVGDAVPVIHQISCPMLDHRGLWVDLEVSYEGMVCLTLETKLNLMKLKKVGEELAATAAAAAAAAKTDREGLSPVDKRGSPMFDSDVDDSAESSDDDTDLDKSTTEEEEAASSGGGTGKKILNMVNKIAASKYFQHAAQYKYIKRAMEEVSNTRLMLTVEVNGLVGTLALNIPPHPSDRLWYGFRGNPRLWLSARPKFGERRVNIGHVITWIEKKLVLEFQKKFVLPNMDDLVIPPMTTNVSEN